VASEYKDDYATCRETHATLRMYHEDLDPDAVSRELGLAPERAFRRGEHHSRTAPHLVRRFGGWFLTSRGAVDSKDVRRHLDWLLDQLEPRSDALRRLQGAGFRMDVSCYWVSSFGHGGPALSPRLMRRLADLNLDVWFDVYLSEAEAEEGEAPGEPLGG
jgi:hypothetical protein